MKRAARPDTTQLAHDLYRAARLLDHYAPPTASEPHRVACVLRVVVDWLIPPDGSAKPALKFTAPPREKEV